MECMSSTSARSPATTRTTFRATRFALALDVTLQGDREARPHRATVVDASTHGLHIQDGVDLLRVGDGVTVTIELGEAVPIVTRGRIVGRGRTGTSAIAFDRLRPIDRGRLGGLLASRGRAVSR